MTRDIEQRKRDHLILAQNEDLNFSISTGFDRWRLIHNALPEINLKEIDTRTKFLGKDLQFPLLISSMSGGVDESFNFNANLATAAETVGCALGLGSIRAALEHEKARDSFLIARKKAPTAIIMANLGIAQIMDSQSIDGVAAFCNDLDANALIIHLNPLQEAFQPEGDTEFRGALDSIRRWVRDFPLPLIVKEVGQGLSTQVVRKLQDVGIETVDIAGAGGSNWISIERERLAEDRKVLRQAAYEFANWGEPTAEILEDLDTDLCVIASGGLKRPLDLPKALALGAQMGGIAGVLLSQALSSDADKLIEQLLVWKKTLEMVMFGVGVSKIDDLIGNRSLLHKID